MDQPSKTQSGKDLRCICGRLTARLEKRGVVIKCQRCGELVVIAIADVQAYLNLPSVKPLPK
jgi:hypothetical protein